MAFPPRATWAVRSLLSKSVPVKDTPDLTKLARLAALPVQDTQALRPDLESLLQFVRCIDELDTTGVEPMWSPLEEQYTLRMRREEEQSDTSLAAVDRQELLSLAQRTSPPYYIAPKANQP
eukprot:jgi/Chlat1/3877/Chrsp26S08860